MKIAAGINVWDDPVGLLYLFEHGDFWKYIDIAYVIDGRYENRGDRPEFDQKITEAIISKYGDRVRYISMGGKKQIDKRNKYWEWAEEEDIDFLLVIDTDEWIEFQPQFNTTLEICKEYDSQCFPIEHDNMGVSGSRPRLFKKPFNYRHKDREHNISHGALYRKDGTEVIEEMYRWSLEYGKRKTILGVKMFHDKKFRSDKRVKCDYVYYNDNPTR